MLSFSVFCIVPYYKPYKFLILGDTKVRINLCICKFFCFFLPIGSFCVTLEQKHVSMRLGVLLPHTKLYGGVKRFLELGNIFVEKGHDFYVFTPEGTPPGWFEFKGTVIAFDQLSSVSLDALWTTTPEYVPMMLASSAKHKIFYHVRIKEKLSPILKDPEVELFACSSNVYEADLKKYGRKAFKAVGGVTVRNYQPKTDYQVIGRPFVVMGYGRLAESVKGKVIISNCCYSIHMFQKRCNRSTNTSSAVVHMSLYSTILSVAIPNFSGVPTASFLLKILSILDGTIQWQKQWHVHYPLFLLRRVLTIC